MVSISHAQYNVKIQALAVADNNALLPHVCYAQTLMTSCASSRTSKERVCDSFAALQAVTVPHEQV